jgi:transposase-like protein
MMSQKFGANATGLSRVQNLSLKTTWNILHKLRRTMVRADREQLGPAVEVDEAYIGSPEEGKPGRGADTKSLIVLAIELDADKKKLGRIRMRIIPDSSGDSLIPFISANVKPGATVITDGWSGYASLKARGFKHEIKIASDEKKALPHVHLVVSLLKRWLIGTYQGGTSSKYLDFYLDEFIFRFNRRKSKSRGKLFRRLIEQAVITPPIIRKSLKIRSDDHEDDEIFLDDLK